MKVVVVYNKHRHGGGADVVAQSTIELLQSVQDVEVYSFVRDSRELRGMSGNIRAFISGCYSHEAVRSFSKLLRDIKPDVVHAHDVYPLISPWIFRVCRKYGVPVVMTCHDYRISCPVVTHFRDGELCYECPEHSELRCIKHNCTGSIMKSASYALRNIIGRKMRLFKDYVDFFLTPSVKAREMLIRNSDISADRVFAVGNPVPSVANPHLSYVEGSYVGYAGRFEPEKGFDLLIEAVKGTGIPLRVAGDASHYTTMGKSIPDNVEFSGYLNHAEIGRFYQEARILVVPSLWHETFGLVVAEALLCGTPVVVSDYGALAEVAGTGGVVVPAGNILELRRSIIQLWNDDVQCKKLAMAGRAHVKQFTNETYLNHIISAYRRGINKVNSGNSK